MRPARAIRAPPIRPSVRSSPLRPRRASQTARAEKRKAAGTTAPAATSPRSSRISVTATATGSAAAPSSPKSSEKAAARFRRGLVPLLLDVGAANGDGRDRAADDAGDGDQREDVGKRLK